MAALSLSRVPIVRNPKYQAGGLKSYVYLLEKYSITPSKEGPYFRANQFHTQGKLGFLKKIGGRTKVRHSVLQKR